MNRLHRVIVSVSVMMCLVTPPRNAGAELRCEYANRFVYVMDWVVKSNNYLREHITDRKLAKYMNEIALRHVEMCRLWTPPEEFRDLHPHFIIMLENAERAFYYAGTGVLSGYRKHHRILRNELRLVDALLDRNRITLPEAPR